MLRSSARPWLLFAVLLAIGLGCHRSESDFIHKKTRKPGDSTEVKALRSKAHTALKRYALEEALMYLDGILTASPKDREALGLTGAIELDRAAKLELDQPEKSQAQLAKAIEAFQKLQAAYPHLSADERDNLANALFLDGRRLARANQTDASLARIKEAVALGFASPEAFALHEDFRSLENNAEFQALVQKLTTQADANAREQASQILTENRPFPFDFHLRDLDGKPVTLADLKKRVTIVDIWGTWCPPCRMEVPYFAELHKKYQERGLAIVGINYEQVEGQAAVVSRIKKGVADLKIPYPCLIGDDFTREQIPEFNGFPTTLFLDESGKVRARLVGAHAMRDLEAIVTALLDSTPPSESRAN